MASRNAVWKISDPAAIARIQALMADKKLLIADGIIAMRPRWGFEMRIRA